MPSQRRTPKSEPLKVWNDWSDGVGYYVDDPSIHGLYSSRLFVGTKGMLQVAPRANKINLTGTHAGHTSTFPAQYFFEDKSSGDNTKLYVISNTHDNNDASGTPDIIKIDTDNANFGTIRGIRQQASRVYPTGQPAKYQANWYIAGSTTAAAGDTRITELTTVAAAAAADTWTETASNAAFAATHIGLINNQLCKYVQGSGVNILKVDGTWSTVADWGSFFEVGDRDEAALALAAGKGAMFTYSRTGIHSFNDRGRVGLAVEDMASWREYLQPQYMKPWKEGFLIAHPTGLLYWIPGSPPINVGLSSKQNGPLVPNMAFTTGVELRAGRYQGFDVVGDNVYAIYVDNVDTGTVVSALALLLHGRAVDGNPTNIAWHVLSASQMNNVNQFHGAFVATTAQPIASSALTPTLFWAAGQAPGDASGQGLRYIPLAGDGSPIAPRSRLEFLDLNSSTSVTVPNSEAYFSELFFSDGVDLTDIVIFTQDMETDDSLEIRLIVDSEDTNINAGSSDPVFNDRQVGAPIQGNGRHLRKIGMQDVYRVMVHLTFSTTGATSRTTPPPSIRQVVLYGNPR